MAERPYLDETSLGRFMRERLDPNTLGNARVPGVARQFRPDYRSERHKLIAEFDGDQHYRSAKHVIEDKTRDQALIEAGYTVIRVPYFVQMTEPVIGFLFGDLITDRTRFKDFPHGFIANTVVFPADFCELVSRGFMGTSTALLQSGPISSLASNVRRPPEATGGSSTRGLFGIA